MTTATGAARAFDRIIFNFPDIGAPDDAQVDPALNAELLEAFLASAAPALVPGTGEAHVALLLDQAEALALPAAAAAAGLRCAATDDFHAHQFPGYHPRQTFPGTKGLPVSCAKRYAFRRSRQDEVAAAAAAAATAAAAASAAAAAALVGRT